MSARAAARLESLGFETVYRYTAGKVDWLANGWPAEGKKAHQPKAGDLARRDVLTCGLDARTQAVSEQVQGSPYGVCVVVDGQNVVLGLLHKEALEHGQDKKAEEVMECGPRTYRLNGDLEKAANYMRKNEQASVLVTYSDGRLAGLLLLADIEENNAS